MLLVGDIGGTKTDLAVFDAEHGPRQPLAQQRFASADYPSLEAIAREFLAAVQLPVTDGCFAVAGPVVFGRAVLTNLPWVVEEVELRTELRLQSVQVLNDVAATAAAVPGLDAGDLWTLQAGVPEPHGTIAVIAPGTGLGEAFLTWDGTRYRTHPSEGSHVDFAPTTPLEIDLLRYLQDRWGRVSVERVCAGRAIPDLYDFLRDAGHTPESPALRERLADLNDRTPAIMAAALEANPPDPLSRAALELFVSVLGAEAGNLALKVLSTGGVYIGGGIPPRILPHATGVGQQLLGPFHTKGRLAPVLAQIPIHVIVQPVALLGVALHGLDNAMSAPGRVSA